MGEFVTLTAEDGVCVMRIDRPPVNALNSQIFDELREAAASCAADDSVRSVIVWGGPKVFAAGADIKELAGSSEDDMRSRGAGFHSALRALERVPKPVIAAITGYALGGGCELSLAADFRFAADNAKLGFPEVTLGVIPGAGGTQRLPRLVGVQKAKELIYSGDMVTAHEALDIGLVDRVTAADDVYEEAMTTARRYAQGPYAMRLAKRAIDEGIDMDLDAGLQLESELFAATFATEDADTGLRSFVEHGPGKARFSYR